MIILLSKWKRRSEGDQLMQRTVGPHRRLGSSPESCCGPSNRVNDTISADLAAAVITPELLSYRVLL